MPKSDPNEKRKCPGEKYAIPRAICLGRQANNYPKCLLCHYHTGEDPEAQSGDPRIKSRIFRTATIAGHVPSEINEYVMRKIGTAAAQCLRAEAGDTSSMAVGHDQRESSRSLARVFCEGVNAGGLHTVDVGAAPPELLRFTLMSRKLGSAAFISGCHAAADVNGVRFFRRNGEPFTFENGLDKIGLIARRIKPGRSRSPGRHEHYDPLTQYRKYVMKFVPQLQPLRIVLDGSHGIAGQVLPFVLGKLPVEVTRNNCQPDARSPFLGQRFPAQRVAGAMQTAVRTADAQLGVAVDYDGDMCAFWDEKGALLRNDVVAALVAREMLERIPGARIAYDLRFTGAVREEILRADGQPLRSPCSPLALIRTTRQKDAVYAADLSGRHFFRDMLGSESPVLATLMLCSLLSRSQAPLSRLAVEVERYSHSGEMRYQMPTPEAAAETVAQVSEEFQEGERDTLDGITCRFSNWWFNLRHPPGSETLRLIVEGRTGSEERHGRQVLERIIRERRGRQSA